MHGHHGFRFKTPNTLSLVFFFFKVGQNGRKRWKPSQQLVGGLVSLLDCRLESVGSRQINRRGSISNNYRNLDHQLPNRCPKVSKKNNMFMILTSRVLLCLASLSCWCRQCPHRVFNTTTLFPAMSRCCLSFGTASPAKKTAKDVLVSQQSLVFGSVYIVIAD